MRMQQSQNKPVEEYSTSMQSEKCRFLWASTGTISYALSNLYGWSLHMPVGIKLSNVSHRSNVPSVLGAVRWPLIAARMGSECLLNIYTTKRWKTVFITQEGCDNKRVVSWLNTWEHLDKQQAVLDQQQMKSVMDKLYEQQKALQVSDKERTRSSAGLWEEETNCKWNITSNSQLWTTCYTSNKKICRSQRKKRQEALHVSEKEKTNCKWNITSNSR